MNESAADNVLTIFNFWAAVFHYCRPNSPGYVSEIDFGQHGDTILPNVIMKIKNDPDISTFMISKDWSNINLKKIMEYIKKGTLDAGNLWAG